MLIVTGVLLTFVLMIMMGKTARTMQGVGWIPITPVDVEFPYWMGIWLGIFPTVETLLAQVAGGVFVIGSYFLAERLKHRRRSAALRRQPQTQAHQNGAGQGIEGSPHPRPLEGSDRTVEQPRI
jgi:high-affinity iron transporter